MKFRVFVFVLLSLCLTRTAQAQTHPCDQPAPATQTIQSGAPHKVAFCSAQTANVEALVAYVDGQAFDLLAIVAKTAPSASGMVLYESPLFLQVAKGTHVLEAALYNRNQFTNTLQLGAKSAPFSFDAVEDTPLPTAPVIKGVSR